MQYYDRLGILPAAGRTVNGRRSYDEADLVRLEEIVFYRSLGFPLQQIQKKLAGSPGLPETDKILSEQSILLYARMESIHTSLAAIEAFREVMAAGRKPPWKFLAEFLSKLNGSDFLDWNWSREKMLSHISGGAKADRSVPVARLIEAGMRNFVLKLPAPAQFRAADLKAIDLPVLALMAGRSAMHHAEQAMENGRRYVRDIQIELWPKVSHAINGECPEEVDRRILAFVREKAGD